MLNSSTARRSGVLSVLFLVGLAVAGCGGGQAAGSSQSAAQGGAGMMGGNSTSQQGYPGMMAAGPGYTYSQLSCSAPTSPAGQRVDVILADMGMTTMMGGVAPMSSRMMLNASPATVPAGQVSLVATNVGWRTHELVILPLSVGATAGRRIVGSDGKVLETGSLGEASGSCAAGTGQGITAGQVGWVTLSLAPGRYELVCNLQNHYADGMHQEFTVN
ncbi:putative cupredoxin-like copper-binding protein [Nakamurella sp. UYEF19]|uniref:sulfocyanin-like copper-binding protein n=1 Tax=Nakamurella sp. UYEF19 TaxID=1756392 RepID=UPI0033981B65